ncbi:MAG TPA: hypothetical protein VFJ85_05580 [Acidimicrobiales bacterium]|nr:hypothetical protein [Acidimicrobiales bacterium]
MSDTVVIVLVVAAVVVAAAAVALVAAQRRRRLQDRFGREYHLAVRHDGGRREAEHDLMSRLRRHDQLQIRPLDRAQHRRFVHGWDAAQARFVDEPAAALTDADRLVGEVMAERGYPTGSFDQRAADLSVEHADVLDHYRAAHAMTRRSEQGQTTTEEQRQAMVHYRAIFTSLLEDSDDRAGAHEAGRNA